MMRFTDIPSAIIESRFTPPPHPWRFQPESCVKRHEISTNTFPVQQCTFSCDKGRPARSSSKNMMEKFILVGKSVTKRQSEKPGGQKEDSVKAQQHFLLKVLLKTKMGNWETESRQATGFSRNSAHSYRDQNGNFHSESSARHSIFQHMLWASTVKSHQKSTMLMHQGPCIARPDTRPQADVLRCAMEKHYLSSVDRVVLKDRKTKDRELRGPLGHLAELHRSQLQASVWSGPSSASVTARQGHGQLGSNIPGHSWSRDLK